ncbi:MAG: ribosomal-processing cysteine protease Prp [Clostridia bacterium]|nr:ribosomal-processing cysteine protease Prp [Clostridia bacterium]
MTVISYTKSYDRHIIECCGHTGYGKIGSDILCSAVSVLCLTAESYLREAYDKGAIDYIDSKLDSGYGYIEFSCKEDTDTHAAIEIILLGFRLLSENFPENISYEE